MNLAALSTLITALTLAACGIHTSRPEWPQARIAIVGDTQRTSLAERMIGREQNDPERLTLIKHIAAERADLLIHLGDMVFGTFLSSADGTL
ncbi:MAG: metallophosphoesterase, partial [Planctomycetota bacterium]